MKTVEQIEDRVRELSKDKNFDDMFFGQRGELIPFCGDTIAKEWLKEGAEHNQVEVNRENVIKAMQDYIDFAVGKALDHRGISAGRSLDHYRALTWILGEEDEINWENYENYGCPVLSQIIEKYGLKCKDASSWDFERMSNAEKCCDDCESGCSE